MRLSSMDPCRLEPESWMHSSMISWFPIKICNFVSSMQNHAFYHACKNSLIEALNLMDKKCCGAFQSFGASNVLDVWIAPYVQCFRLFSCLMWCRISKHCKWRLFYIAFASELNQFRSQLTTPPATTYIFLSSQVVPKYAPAALLHYGLC